MVTWDDFDKIWASTSPLTPYEFSAPNYSQGWNFVGSTPPARQMWDSIQKKNDEKFKYLRDNFGTPNIVTQASQMTDTEKVYVYIGSEAGWNNGHWYYWDGSAWADGGVYNAIAFVTDTTLSIAGQAADAKAVGDALALKADLAGCTFTGNVSINADFSVTGDSTLTGNVSASGDIVVVGDVSSANMTTSADATIGGALSVAGASTLTGNVSAGADITVVGDVSSANIIASNNANIGGNATVTGSVASASLTTTADGTIGGNLSVSGTTALIGTSTAPTPSADDNSTKIATTEYVQTEIKPIETDVDIAEKDIANIKALLQGHLYDYQTDSTSAYTKSVPAGAMPYAGIEKIGGKTVVWNQLQDNSQTTRTVSDVDFTKNDDGSWTINGTATSYGRINIGAVAVKANHRYFVFGSPSGGSENTYGAGLAMTYNDSVYLRDFGSGGTIVPGSDWPAGRIAFSFHSGDSFNNVTTFFKVFDATLMFGAGNEPTTVDEFVAMFPMTPEKIVPYNAGTLLSAGVTEVVSKDSNDVTLQTISIPTAIRNLEGYGWSAGYGTNFVSNYIDFERKVYVKQVGRIDLGTMTWYDRPDYTYHSFEAVITGAKPTQSTGVPFTIGLCDKYYWLGNTAQNATTLSAMGDKGIGQLVRQGAIYVNLWITDSSYTDVSTFKTSLSGTYLYYTLSTPVETDISAYITDDNLIEVEAGGTLTFENQHGDDYQIPVPSEEEYMIDLQEAINNG